MRGTARSSAGFTLPELMVVLTIVALLGVMAVPSFNDFLASRRLSGAVSQLMTDLQNARSEAVTRNTDVVVTFSATGYSLSSGGTAFRSVALSNGTGITTGNDAVITFTRRGVLNPVASTAVTLANSSHSLRVTLHPLGRVQCAVVSGNASC